MVRFGVLVLASALLATPVLGIEVLTRSAAAGTSDALEQPSNDAVLTTKTIAAGDTKAGAVLPSCERTVRVVYAGGADPQASCRQAR